MVDKLKLGVITGLRPDMNEEFKKIADMGLETCQLAAWEPQYYTDDIADAVKKAAKDNNVEITSLWLGYPGPAHWNFTEGPSTIGLVPPEFREMRLDSMLGGIEFAVRVGAPSVTTHAGFIPENPNDPLYKGTVEALTKLAVRCHERGMDFCFETGQETPTTLLRVMQDIGTDNLGVNIDPANLLMYGKANPVDALDILGPYVKGVHAKDGEYPTNPNELGVEKPLGQGRVDFPRFMAKLKEYGYSGAITIEREISGEQQIVDIKRAIELLRPLC